MPKDPTLQVLQAEPFNAQPPLHKLIASAVTPVELFYVCTHGTIPQVSAADFRLETGGMVERPLRLRLGDLAGNFPVVEHTATLQCAGHRRDELMRLRAIPGEVPWGAAAAGTAVWRGTPLVELLRGVGILDGAEHVAFAGLDQCERDGERFAYGASIPLRRALQRDVLLAWEMNGQPLAPEHGFPLRVVVPGWIGARSVKWVHAIRVQLEPSDNHFQQRANRLFPAAVEQAPADWSQGTMLGEGSLTAVICDPADGAELRAGRVSVAGYALAGGHRTVERVEVSADHGASWVQARVADGSPGAWRLWEADMELAAGAHEIICRAWDSAAMTQPEDAGHVWNYQGLMNNSWHRVRAWVA